MVGEAVGRRNRAEVRLGYRPFLDGLRAVAVYLVVAFHGGSDRFAGGFVGVDVFFVLSGYLVTRLLVGELVESGQVVLRRFYARRFRRLLPASFVTLVVTALVFSAVASPVEVAEAEAAFQAAFLYIANLHFVAESADYFGADVAASPVLHFWSLAVEEQFYLVWPLLLGGLFAAARRLGRRRWLGLQLAVAGLAVASWGWAWSLRVSDPDHAYYGTDARVYQLMAGALVALTPQLVVAVARSPRWARAAGMAGLVGLVLVASAWADLDPIERGTAVTWATVAALIGLEAARGGLARRMLSWEPVVYLGKISYGTYLWHWPVVIVMARSFDLSVPSTIGLTALVATGLASLSFQLLEHPIRVSGLLDRYRVPVIASGLAVSVVSAFVLIPAIADEDRTTVVATTSGRSTPVGAAPIAGSTPVPTEVDWGAVRTDYPSVPDCDGRPVSECTIVSGAGDHILLIGDSHAGMMIPALQALAERADLTFSADLRAGCPWQRNLYRVPRAGHGIHQPIEPCREHKEDVYGRVVPSLRPDLIIAMNVDYPRRALPFVGPDEQVLKSGSEALEEWLETTTRASLEALTEDRTSVVVVEPIPVANRDMNPVVCLSSAVDVESCRYVVDPGPSVIESLYRALDAESEQVWSADLDRLVCPYLPICDPIIGGHVVQIDGSHLTSAYSRSLADEVLAYLRGLSLVEP